MSLANRATVVVPPEGFANVVRLVLAGYVAPLSLGYDAVDELQLAVELALRALPLAEERATVSFAHDPAELTITLGAFTPGALGSQLHTVTREGMDMMALLARLVDEVETGDSPQATLTLHKRLGTRPA
jgi:hypothetical protein